MRRRRKNPITTDQILLVALGAVGGAVALNWYQNRNASSLGSNYLPPANVTGDPNATQNQPTTAPTNQTQQQPLQGQ